MTEEHIQHLTKLTTEQIKVVLRDVLRGAEISSLEEDPLSEPSDFAILAQQQKTLFKHSDFGRGMACAQVIIVNRGDHREINFVAFGTGVGQQIATSFAHEDIFERNRALKSNPVMRSSKKMVSSIIEAVSHAEGTG
ncbi:hypothetical protein [Kocuria sp.]|uniref:hypothetical protein n=1 Tax=Kocuria sp. TaxID=1871328 RepID=UPI0025BF01B5|nr:hypothetical protein [Kocuria sp.]